MLYRTTERKEYNDRTPACNLTPYSISVDKLGCPRKSSETKELIWLNVIVWSDGGFN